MGLIVSKFWRFCVWLEGGEGVDCRDKGPRGELQKDTAGGFAQYLGGEAGWGLPMWKG